jgi:hypothetical protein
LGPHQQLFCKPLYAGPAAQVDGGSENTADYRWAKQLVSKVATDKGTEKSLIRADNGE